MDRVQPIVAKYGKTVIAWHQITGAHPAKGAIAQYWGLDDTDAAEKAQVAKAAQNGTGLILSPGAPCSGAMSLVRVGSRRIFG